ncbi:hypothetical protein BH10PSE10_BH10PSE10_18590 [soil metagenome]
MPGLVPGIYVLTVVPAQAGTRHPCQGRFIHVDQPSLDIERAVVMGPGLRRDDIADGAAVI